MNDSSNQQATPPSVEEMLSVSLSNARQSFLHRCQKWENQIRKSPKTAVFGAVAAGYFLHRMPVRAILVTQVRVLSALTPPALFLFGAAKLYNLLQRKELGRSE